MEITKSVGKIFAIFATPDTFDRLFLMPTNKAAKPSAAQRKFPMAKEK